MAYIYKDQPGRRAGTQYVVANLDGVQGWLDSFIFEAGVRAETILQEHRMEGHASIDIEEGDIDRYLILNDERGQGAAMSIEYGHKAYGIDADGDPVPADDPDAVYVVGQSEGIYVLHKAVRMPKNKLKGTGGGTV